MRKALSIFFMGVGVLTLLFFRAYDGDIIPYPYLVFTTGILIGILGLRLFIRSNIKTDKEIEYDYKSDIQHLKNKGRVLEVKFDDCEIVSNKFYEEQPKSNNYRSQAFDSAYNDNDSVVRSVVNQARIVYKHNIEGRNVVFQSPIINKDEITLNFLLDRYQATKIYVDVYDHSNYYFDIEFIDQ
jgi:hypothetical protein